MSQPPIIIIITHPHPGSATTSAKMTAKDERSFTSIDDAIAYLKSLKK